MKNISINIDAFKECLQQITDLNIAYYSKQITVDSYKEQLTQLSINSVIKVLEPMKEYEISEDTVNVILCHIGNQTRWEVFCYISENYRLTPKAQAEGLKYAWVHGRADYRACSLFSRISPTLIMDDEENRKYKEMPDIIRIYRGCHKDEADLENGNFFGLSWTYNREIAEFFAFRDRTHPEEDGRVFSVEIPKEYIYALILGRDEDEVIFDFYHHFDDPDKVEIITDIPTSYYENYLIRKGDNE